MKITVNHARHMAHLERVYLRWLVRTSRTIAHAARRSGINRTHLYKLLRSHGIEP